MAHKGMSVKTEVGELRWVFIKGEGRNQAMKGEDPRMQYVATVVFKKDSDEHKKFKALVAKEWKAYCAETGTKGAPKTTGIKPIMVESGEVDEYGAPKKVESDLVQITFKTNTHFKGKPHKVKVLSASAKDITDKYGAVEWGIGEGSEGIIHGTAQGNDVGGSPKVTLYLNAVQITHLVKYEGTSVDAEEVEGEEIDFGMDELEAGEEPAL